MLANSKGQSLPTFTDVRQQPPFNFHVPLEHPKWYGIRIYFFTFPPREFFFLALPERVPGGKKGQEEREQQMEVTGDDTVETEDPREWNSEKVTTFVRSLRTVECFQSTGDQVLDLGVDNSVFCTLSLNTCQGVCGHPRCMIVCVNSHTTTKMRVRTQ